MALLKEDGSLDIERINKLPIEDYMEEIASLNKKQYNEYISTLPLNESHEQVKNVKLDCTIEEDMKRNGAVLVYDLLTEIRKKYGID